MGHVHPHVWYCRKALSFLSGKRHQPVILGAFCCPSLAFPNTMSFLPLSTLVPSLATFPTVDPLITESQVRCKHWRCYGEGDKIHLDGTERPDAQDRVVEFCETWQPTCRTWRNGCIISYRLGSPHAKDPEVTEEKYVACWISWGWTEMSMHMKFKSADFKPRSPHWITGSPGQVL